MDEFARIAVDPDVMGGAPCIRGMRVTARSIYQYLEAGIPREDVLKAYPYLESEDLDEVERFARQSIHFRCVPKDKYDVAAVERTATAGYPAVAPVIPQLLEWIQDMNWPVAEPMSEYLVKLGPILIPYLEIIFQTDDHIWIRNVVYELIIPSPILSAHFKETLEDLAAISPIDEASEDLKETATDALARIRELWAEA